MVNRWRRAYWGLYWKKWWGMVRRGMEGKYKRGGGGAMLTGQAKVDYQREYMRKRREKQAAERASEGGGKRRRPFEPKGSERVRSNWSNNQKPDAYIRNDVRPKAVRFYGMNVQRALDYMIELNKAGFTLTPGPPYRMVNMKTGEIMDYAVEPCGMVVDTEEVWC